MLAPRYPGQANPESQDLYRTRLGLLLLAVGVVASQPFGQAHTRNAKVGLVLAFAGGLAAYYVTAAFPLVLTTPPSSMAQLPS